MSHNRIQYRIYADDQTQHTSEDWAIADRHINGFAYSCDFREAVAIAKKSAKNCKFPFVVLSVPVGGKRAAQCDVWVIK